MLLLTAWFGTMLIDRASGKVLEFMPASKDAQEIAKRLLRITLGEILEEEKEMAEKAKSNGYQIEVCEPRLSNLGNYIDGKSPDLLELAEERGYTRLLLHASCLELARIKTRTALSGDKHIIQAVNAADELTKTANLLSERLHEWYGLHFPEFAEMAKEDEFVNLIANYGDRFSVASNSKLNLDPSRSVGGDISHADRDAIMAFAHSLLEIYSAKEKIEKYISERMEEIAPNLAKLAGPIIGARLIALTGGLERLATLPASAVQLLGAEKALFRHIREGESPPKYGVIFQHPLIHKSPYWQRGKIARAFAGKIAIASKVDAHSGRYIGDELQEQLDKRIAEIAKKYPKEPKRLKIIEQPKVSYQKFGKGPKGKRREERKEKKKGLGKQKWFAKKGKGR